MADSYIQVALDSNGKKLQTFVNPIAGSDVHSEAVTLVDQFGVALILSDGADFIADSTRGFPMMAVQRGGGVLRVLTCEQALTIEGSENRLIVDAYADDGAIGAIGATTDTAQFDYTVDATLIAYIRGMLRELGSIDSFTSLVSHGAGSLATSQVTSTGTAATIAIARATRRSVCFTNTHATGSVRIGPATVTAGNGQILGPGESKVFTCVGLYQVIDDGSTHCVVCVADEY